ncbi:hypothetical protein NXG27_04675 [Megasphaera paucivorans]|uniref:Uncharacterized protein n=1 Tax=Megasphaera paucivorans TaxID=349095 RepID=A0A1G9XDN6_9FIRM|nr:hypothetical protein [Megasphaera paucivorans]SDM94395.1 hypothetical protein SAMN05660299_01808 [Megasphaera paucivorans]
MCQEVLASEDIHEIFSHQMKNGQFSSISTVTAGLNYLDLLNRSRLDVLAANNKRTAAARKAFILEKKLYQYIRQQTPLSVFDTDYRQEITIYIRMRELFLTAGDFTFKQHRFSFLLELIQLYREDICEILTGRDAILQKWERELFYNYLLMDMGKKNTEDIGKEAISNGYHECDYTLEIENVWKQPAKSIPRTNFSYVLQSLPISNIALCTLAYMRDHCAELRPSLWIVDDTAIWNMFKSGYIPSITKKDIITVAATYIK